MFPPVTTVDTYPEREQFGKALIFCFMAGLCRTLLVGSKMLLRNGNRRESYNRPINVLGNF